MNWNEPQCCTSRPEAYPDYEEDYHQTCPGDSTIRYLTCPEEFPFQYTYATLHDSCCASEPYPHPKWPDLNYCNYDDLDFCGEDFNDSVCYSHPSVLKEGNVKILIKSLRLRCRPQDYRGGRNRAKSPQAEFFEQARF